MEEMSNEFLVHMTYHIVWHTGGMLGTGGNVRGPCARRRHHTIRVLYACSADTLFMLQDQLMW